MSVIRRACRKFESSQSRTTQLRKPVLKTGASNRVMGVPLNRNWCVYSTLNNKSDRHDLHAGANTADTWEAEIRMAIRTHVHS
jgi:hypothetical protein